MAVLWWISASLSQISFEVLQWMICCRIFLSTNWVRIEKACLSRFLNSRMSFWVATICAYDISKSGLGVLNSLNKVFPNWMSGVWEEDRCDGKPGIVSVPSTISSNPLPLRKACAWIFQRLYCFHCICQGYSILLDHSYWRDWWRNWEMGIYYTTFPRLLSISLATLKVLFTANQQCKSVPQQMVDNTPKTGHSKWETLPKGCRMSQVWAT